MKVSTKAKLISTALVAAAVAAPGERIAQALAGRSGAECLWVGCEAVMRGDLDEY
jgi:hypothetical protein